ncbi:hypothetical protein GN958_ATG22653 [Phytophthora infestans]|nr:hypothetical protein GN958_ATG22653 [Phytophthora infestans]
MSDAVVIWRSISMETAARWRRGGAESAHILEDQLVLRRQGWSVAGVKLTTPSDVAELSPYGINSVMRCDLPSIQLRA